MDLSNVVWRKARRSTENGGDCVELASANSLIAVRDSKDPDGSKVIVSRDEFRRIVEALKAV